MDARRIISAGILLILSIVFARLGWWQWERMHEKTLLIEEFQSAPEVLIGDALVTQQRYVRTRVYGQFRAEPQFLVDNKIWRGQAGVHVLSVFDVAGQRPFLVNRGWLPLAADRSSLPEVTTPNQPVEISGLLTLPAEDGFRLGEAQPIDRDVDAVLMTYFDLPTIRDSVGPELADRILLLDADAVGGFSGREWQAAVMQPGQHRAYAVQWFALSLAALILLAGVSYPHKRGRE